MPEPRSSTIALLGTGYMGAGMARNLLAAGFSLRAWNRTREKLEPLAEHGADVVDSPGEAAQGADLLLTMLSDADTVAEVVQDGALAAGPTVWVQASTVGIQGTERLMALAEEHGIPYVDAPVLGTRKPAEEGKLTVLASGPDEAVDRCQPLFDAIGARTLRLGDAGEATRLKLATNLWVLTVVEGLAESLSLAGHLGVDPAKVLEAISGGPLDLPYAQVKGGAMLERDFAVSFPLRLAAKDAVLMQRASDGLDLPLLEGITQALTDAEQAGHGDLDVAATFLARTPDGG